MQQVAQHRARIRVQLADWPTVDARALAEPARSVFRTRIRAIEAVARGDLLRVVEAASGLHRAAINRLIARAQLPHPDGRIWGYRALVPQARVRGYVRTAAPQVLVNRTAGNSGAFAQLLLRHPKLMAQLRAELQSGKVTLQQSGERGRMSGVAAASRRFIDACRQLGLDAGNYPLNQADKAVRSLARTLRGWMDDDLSLSARAAAVRVKPASALRRLPERGALEAFDTVEFDAHKLDVRLRVIDRDPLGVEQSLEIERVWLLAVIDVTTRCVLGHHLSLGRECSRFDVIETIKHALVPASPPVVTLAGLSLLRSGGMVSQALPQTQFACWRQIRLDNARAHLATTSLDVLCETLGCTADFGPAYQPDDRPFIERFFGTLTSTLSRRLPGAIPPRAAAPAAALRRLRNAGTQLVVTVQELQELLEVTVWNYHGTPHASLGGLTPLELMRRHVLGIERAPIRLRTLLGPLRLHPQLLHDPVACRVHGNLARGERPYVSFMHVRYTSPQLARRPSLVGHELRVHCDPADLRTLTACAPDGELMEPLQASGPWRHEPHSLWLRRAFFKAKRARQLSFAAGESPIDAFLALRRKEAPKNKRAASDMARAQRDRTRPPSQQVASAQEDEAPSNLPSQLAMSPVRGSRLRITRGFAR